MKSSLFLALFLFVIVSLGYSQQKESRKERRRVKQEIVFEEVATVIDSSNYIFNALKANPTGGQQVDLTTHTAFLKVRDNSIEAYLPYFGRAFTATYGGGDSGIKFNTSVENYKVEKNIEKMSITVSFSAKANNDTYKCTLTVIGKKSATLFVTSNKRASISYYGDIELLDKSVD